MNAVARRAEVGVGTAYRHFATPEALRVDDRFVELIELAGDAAGIADPVSALRMFLSRALRVHADDPAFAAVTTSARVERAENEALRTELVGKFGEIVQRAATELRPGFDTVPTCSSWCAESATRHVFAREKQPSTWTPFSPAF